MKILILAGQFYPDLAGSGVATHSIAVDLAHRGHAVTVCIDSTNQYLDKVSANPPFSLKFIPDFKKFMTSKAGFKLPTEAIYKILKDEEFDVIHVYSYMPMLLLSLIKDLTRVPIIFTFWNAPSKGERALGLYQSSTLGLQLARQIISLRKYDRMILGSRASFESAIDLGADLLTTSFTYHGINMSDFAQNMKSPTGIMSDYFNYDTTNNEAIITLPGRITARKGVFEAVRALAIVRETHKARLLLTSTDSQNDDAPTIDELMKLADELNVRNNISVSKQMIPQKHMPLLYKHSNIVITPSYYEGLGFTAIEALAAARPLVMTDVQGLNEIGVNNKNCLVIPAKDEGSLANAILKLLGDEGLAQNLSKEGQQSVRKFDMRLFVNNLIEVYKEVKNDRNLNKHHPCWR